MHYYSHHIGDFDLATRHLSRLERSIYRDLMEVYYETETQLTLDLSSLCRRIIARSADEVTAVEQVLNEFFTKTPNGWYQSRCEEELDRYRLSTSQKSLAGKASAAKREEKRLQALQGNPTSVERAFNGTPTNQEPITNNQEPLTNNQKIKSIVPPSGETKDVFDYWQKFHNHPQAKLDDKRSRAIKARLKDGYSVGELCKAVEGCKYSEYHQGKNDNGMVYDDIELICRNATNVDKFIALANKGPPNGVSQNMNQTLSMLQQWVLEEENGES